MWTNHKLMASSCSRVEFYWSVLFNDTFLDCMQQSDVKQFPDLYMAWLRHNPHGWNIHRILRRCKHRCAWKRRCREEVKPYRVSHSNVKPKIAEKRLQESLHMVHINIFFRRIFSILRKNSKIPKKSNLLNAWRYDLCLCLFFWSFSIRKQLQFFHW